MAEELLEQDPYGSKIARVLRRTYDMLHDGQHTGRYRWDQLSKTEKTHFGTLAEINLQRAFGFADGTTMDFAIHGVDVDCKFSQNPGDWMIPPGGGRAAGVRPVGQRRPGPMVGWPDPRDRRGADVRRREPGPEALAVSARQSISDVAL